VAFAGVKAVINSNCFANGGTPPQLRQGGSADASAFIITDLPKLPRTGLVARPQGMVGIQSIIETDHFTAWIKGSRWPGSSNADGRYRAW
jgi:hypothetical protein